MKIITLFWKICNTREKGELELFKHKLRGEISNPQDIKLKILLKIGDMAEKMTASGKKRTRQLSKDTGTALAHLCRGLVDMTRTLLSQDPYDYVLLGWFTTDPLEKYFGKLRQGCGGTYFITAQAVLEKTRILQTKLLLQLGVEIDGNAGHSCDVCERPLNERETEIMDNLVELEESIPRETMLSLIYIAGYIERNKDDEEMEDTTDYYQRYPEYFDALNRGSLKIPKDHCAQWVAFSYIFFTQLVDRPSEVCLSFLVKQFSFIAEKYGLDICGQQCRMLGNIFLKNFSFMMTPNSAKEAKLKELKLN